jgi:hypothetical protein
MHKKKREKRLQAFQVIFPFEFFSSFFWGGGRKALELTPDILKLSLFLKFYFVDGALIVKKLKNVIMVLIAFIRLSTKVYKFEKIENKNLFFFLFCRFPPGWAFICKIFVFWLWHQDLRTSWARIFWGRRRGEICRIEEEGL